MTEEYKKRIVELYIELGTYKKVKDILGCSWDNICQATKEAGINKGLGGNHPNMVPDSVIIQLSNSGKTVKEIAQQLGVYNGTIAKRLRKLGIEPVFVNNDDVFDYESKRVEKWTGGKYTLIGIHKANHGRKFEIKCNNCGEIFFRDPAGIKTRDTRCPKCYKPKNKGYVRKLARSNFAKAEYSKAKKCVICGSVFHNSDERRKTCSAECAKILKESNHGLKRFRHKGGEIIDYGITLKRVFERDKGKCWICGCQTNFDDVLYTADGHKYCGKTHPVKDHLIPLSHGGDESWENIRLACWQCNKEKSDALVNIDETTRGKKLVVSERCGKKDGSIPIAQYSINGELIKTFESIMQASRETGIAHCQISAVKNGRQKTAHGYIWKSLQPNLKA